MLAQIVTATVPTGSGPSALAVNPITNRIYVADPGSNNVTVIEGATNATVTVPVDCQYAAVAVNPVTNKIYVTNYAYEGIVTVIDGATDTTTSVKVGSYPGFIAINTVTNKIYIANASSVSVIDGATDATSSVAITGNLRALAINPVTNQIYVANWNSENVTVIDGTTNATSSIAVSSFPNDQIAVNPATNKIYMSGSDSRSLSVIDGATNAITPVAIDGTVASFAINTVTNQVYVSSHNGTVTVIDGSSNAAIATIGGVAPGILALDTASNKIYVTNSGGGSVTVIDGVTNATISIPVGFAPSALLVNPATDLIYVANQGSNTATVIDGSPAATFTMMPVAFPATPVGQSTPLRNLILGIHNHGLAISGIAVTPTLGGVKEFIAGQPQNCKFDGATVIPAGATCTIPIVFQPAYPGVREAALSVQTSEGVFRFGLTAMAQGPQAAFLPGLLSTVAGNGTGMSYCDPTMQWCPPYPPNTGLATSTNLNNPMGIAVDAAGNLFIADQIWYNDPNYGPSWTGAVSKVDAVTGLMTTLLGGGSDTGDGGLASNVGSVNPISVALDASGDLFFADQGTGSVRRVDASTSVISTVYSGSPLAVAVDTAGNLYVADTQGLIEKVAGGTGAATVVAGNIGGFDGSPCGIDPFGDGCLALDSSLSSPSGLAVDAANNIYIADTANCLVRRVDASTGVITAVAGNGQGGQQGGSGQCQNGGYSGDNGPASSASLLNPLNVTVDSGDNLYIWDGGFIRKVDTTGTITTIAGSSSGSPCGRAINIFGDGCPATANGALFGINQLSNQQTNQQLSVLGIALDAAGNLYLSDSNAIRKISASAAPLDFQGSVGIATAPQTVTVANTGNVPLALSSMAVDYVNENFALDAGSTTCSASASLAAGGSCAAGVTFYWVVPYTGGYQSGLLLLTDNTLNQSGSLQQIALTGNYSGQLTATPTFSIAAGTYFATQSLVLADSTISDTTIYYTTDGTLPTTSSAVYTAPIAVNQSMTVQALATARGYWPSATTLATYTLVAPTPPEFSPMPGVYTSKQSVVLTDPIPGVTIYYTTDGTAPTTSSPIYTAPISVKATTTIEAMASLPGWQPSEIVGGTYELPTVTETAVIGKTLKLASVTITFTQTVVVSAIQALTQGVQNSDFQIAGGGTCYTGIPYFAGNSCTVNVTFTPSSPGVRMGAVVLLDENGNPAAEQFVQDYGQGAAIAFGPGTQTTPTITGLGFPTALAVDGNGNLYVYDSDNAEIWQVPAQGVPVSIGGYYAGSGLAMDGAGNLYLANGNGVSEIMAAGSPPWSNTPVFGGSFCTVQGVAVDGVGNVYISDDETSCFGWYYTSSGVWEFPAGSGSPVTLATNLSQPGGIAVDGAGNVFVVEYGYGTSSLLEIPAGGGAPVTVFTGESTPQAVAVDPVGNVYTVVLDPSGSQVLEIPAGSDTPITITSTTSGGCANGYGCALAVDSAGDLYLANWNGAPVVKLNRSLAPSLAFGTQSLGTVSVPQTFTAENIGNLNLSLKTLSVAANFVQEGSGGDSDCVVPVQMTPGATCSVSVAFSPVVDGNISGSIVLGYSGISKSNTSTTISLTGSSTGQVVTAPALTLNCQEVTYDGTAHSCTGSATGPGGKTVTGAWSYSPANLTTAGSYMVTGTFASSDPTFASGTADATLIIDQAATQLVCPSSAVTYTSTPAAFCWANSGAAVTFKSASGAAVVTPGSYGSTLTLATKTGTVTIKSATAPATTNYKAFSVTSPVTFTTAPMPATITSCTYTPSVSYGNQMAQTIGLPLTVTYGDSGSFECLSNSPMPLTYKVTSSLKSKISAGTLSFNAAETVTLTVTQVAGQGYAAAVWPPASVTSPTTTAGYYTTVAQRPLTLQVKSQTWIYGSPKPAYSIAATGLVNGDQLTKLTYSETNSAGTAVTLVPSLPLDVYTIAAAVVMPNYNVTSQPGTYTYQLNTSPTTGLIMNPANGSAETVFKDTLVNLASKTQLTVKFTNKTGAASLTFTPAFTTGKDFTVVNAAAPSTSTCSASRNSACIFYVDFTPVEAGALSDTLSFTVTDNDNTATFTDPGSAGWTPAEVLTVGGSAIGTLTALPPTFLQTQDLSINTRNVVLTNSTAWPVTIAAMTSNNGHLIVDTSTTDGLNTCLNVVPAGGNCNIPVTFAPIAGKATNRTTGLYSGALTIRATAATSDAPADALPVLSVPLSATEISWSNTAAVTTAFLNTQDLSTNIGYVMVTNNSWLPMTGITATPAPETYFTVVLDQTNTCSQSGAPAGGTCLIPVQFAPVANKGKNGVFSASLGITGVVQPAASGSDPVVLTVPAVTLTANDVPWSISASVTTSFPLTTVGQTSATAGVVTVTNPSGVPLTVTAATPSTAYFTVAMDATNTCFGSGATSTPAGGSCVIPIAFSPVAGGAATETYSAKLVFTATVQPAAAGSTAVAVPISSVSLTATDQPWVSYSPTPTTTAAPATLTFTGTGTTAPVPQTITVVNNGDLKLATTTAFSGVTATPSAVANPFKVKSNSCKGSTGGGGKTCTIVVTSTLPKGGTASGTLTITDGITPSVSYNLSATN
jgi:YVTN family beta-propeller protein